MKKKLKIIIIIFIICLIVGIMLFVLLNKEDNTLLNNPTDKEIESVIKNLKGVTSTCLVTEDNDPNGNLNKQGGYTGAVYFRLEQVDKKEKADDIKEFGEDFVNSENWESYYEQFSDACDAGTDGGGQIEIYPNKSTAEKRDAYLSNLDGFLSGGSHTVAGTLVIRISHELSSSQQKALTTEIINMLNNSGKN